MLLSKQTEMIQTFGKKMSIQIFILEVTILKSEAFLLPLTPFLVIKVDVSPLLVFVGDSFGFFMALEPHHVLGVKTPRLLLQRLRSRILGTCSFLIIEDEEEGFGG